MEAFKGLVKPFKDLIRSLKGLIRPLEGPYKAHLAGPPGLVALPCLVRV